MENEEDEIDATGKSEITCPHCGYEHGDSWEQKWNEGVETCQGCGKKFEWVRDVCVTYDSYPISSNDLPN